MSLHDYLTKTLGISSDSPKRVKRKAGGSMRKKRERHMDGGQALGEPIDPHAPPAPRPFRMHLNPLVRGRAGNRMRRGARLNPVHGHRGGHNVGEINLHDNQIVQGPDVPAPPPPPPPPPPPEPGIRGRGAGRGQILGNNRGRRGARRP